MEQKENVSVELMITTNEPTAGQFHENEVIRNQALNERPDPKLTIRPLLEMIRLKSIHASWLFVGVQQSKLLLSSFCRSLSSYSAYSDSSWQHFGGNLGIDWVSLQVILNDSSVRDKTELCLLTYAQKKNSTLNKIVDFFAAHERYDALTKAKEGLEKLVEFIYSQEGQQLWDAASLANYGSNEISDNGYYSLEDGENDNKIIRPRFWEKLFSTILPISLQVPENILNTSTKDELFIRPHMVKSNYQQAVPTTNSNRKKKISSKTVFLTFASDGRDAAARIAAKLRAQNYGVLMLEENEKILMRNPEPLISALFNKIKYVMPILTKGYLQTIMKSYVDFETTNAMTLMDERYARYIFSLMCADYCDNACFNRKVLCIVPEEIHYNSIADKLRGLLVFKIWANENSIDSFVKKLL